MCLFVVIFYSSFCFMSETDKKKQVLEANKISGTWMYEITKTVSFNNLVTDFTLSSLFGYPD